MGQWTIVIEGTGAHHNPSSEAAGAQSADAEKLAKRFVDELTRRGHSVQHATFTHSARESLLGARNPAEPFK